MENKKSLIALALVALVGGVGATFASGSMHGIRPIITISKSTLTNL